ncbi:hypothetical protein LTR05_007329 [Lithohypha guttulata]|uniref:Cytochrome P450 n=1 Tax=Lithohypha guttulata TaxID=1690604 RepID=A0AAN7SV08_9EURO|nr:hypothetical protein LTR05_007329 [Lithohypha guttulata]
MVHLVLLLLAAPPVYLLYAFVASYYQAWRYEQTAAAKGCKRAPMRPYKYPGGLDMIARIFQADARHQIPNEFERICFQEMQGKTTFEQYLFGGLVFFTIDPENIQAILAKQFNDFELGPSRRGNFWPFLGNGIFTADGADWSHARAMLRPQFARNLVADLELEEKHVGDLLKHIPVKTSDGWTDNIDLQPLFFRLTLDSATEFLFSESVHSQITALPASARNNEKLSNPTGLDLIEVGKAFDRATHMLGKRARFAENYWLYNPKQFKTDCKLVHKFADFFVQRALTSDLEKADTGRYVFLHELVKVTRDPIELRSQLLNIFLAGRDTTAGLLGWVFWVLARHPDIFQKLRETVLNEFGTYEKPRNITFESLKACTYLQHVMNETLRLYPSVPLNSRRAVRDTTIPVGGGPDGKSPIFVPKGTQVDYAVHVMHRRKDIYGEDVNEFKPSRWVGKRVGWEYLPFNGGPRICLGQQFALTEAGYVIVRLMQKYDRIENLSSVTEEDPLYQYSVTTAPWEVNVRLREARN